MRLRSGARLFAVYAGATLVPIVALGFVLDHAITSEIDDRALAEAASRAETIADASIEPALDPGADLSTGVTPTEREKLLRVADALHGDAAVLRLRLRTPGGAIAFDPEHPDAPVVAAEDDEVEEAASGTPVRVLTQVGADAVDGGSTNGEQAVETYVAFHDQANQHVVGVLETYLPYAPFRDAATQSKHRITELLVLGLLGLWCILALITWSVTRRLRRSAQDNDWLAHHDALTGLPNRVGFADDLADRTAGPVSVSVVDVARFREINDTLGHRTADEFLQGISGALRSALGDDVGLARLGGDHFGVVAPTDDPAAVAGLHERIVEAAARPQSLGGIDLGAEVAIGWATGADVDDGPDGILRAAELALHAAKETGTSPLRYRAELDHYDPERLALAGELGAAIAGGQLVLHYQPKLDLRTGEVHAVEALVRWMHPRRGTVGPDEFVPVAESTSLITPLTDWVVAEAIAQLTDWHHRGIDLSMSVNVSARNLEDPDFPVRLLALLERSGVPSGRLVLEITETAIVADPVRAGELLARLHRAGVRISLDDFGQGATSLTSLAGLPLDEIKVDRSFVVGMERSPERRAVVEFVITLGHRLGLTVVAEGIETEVAAADLVALGCDQGQGYLYSRPVPGPDLVAWLGHHERTTSARSASAGSPLEPAVRTD